MILLRQNFFNTTTQATTSNGTSTVLRLFDNSGDTQWISENAGTDATSTTLTVIFTDTQTVSNLVVMGTNLKDFSIYYNTVTSTNLWVSETTNSATNLYYAVTTNTAIEKVIVSGNATQTSNEEKKIGELVITNLLYDFTSDRLPSAKGYKPKLDKMQFVHKMSDGGTVLYNLNNNFNANIQMDFVPTSTVDTLKTVYDLGTPFIFVPHETTSSWDAAMYETVWVDDFEFLRFSNNAKANGFSGAIKLRQTPGGEF